MKPITERFELIKTETRHPIYTSSWKAELTLERNPAHDDPEYFNHAKEYKLTAGFAVTFACVDEALYHARQNAEKLIRRKVYEDIDIDLREALMASYEGDTQKVQDLIHSVLERIS